MSSLLTNNDFSYTKLEHEVQAFWKDSDIYQKILKKNQGNEKFRFMDGPPFVSSNSLHFGHLMIGFLKSSVLNYNQMKGKDCLNELGYDCHGLPIEMVANKKLNISTRQDVDNLGIENYNMECKNMINTFAGQWTPIYERIGRFANFNKTYKTMDTNFMESVWWVFAELYKKNLIYKGYRVMPFSTSCNSSLSNFEASQNYKEIETKSIYVMFEKFEKVSDTEKPTYFVAWTTTPWTLPSNLALCMNPEGVYITYELSDKIIICGENQMKNLDFLKDPVNYKIIGKNIGKDFKGVTYKPLFNYFNSCDDSSKYKILCDNYVDVNSSIGTGIVHLAPAFGEDDYRVCVENNIVKSEEVGDYCPVDDEGKFTSKVTDFAGRLVTDKDTNDEVIKYLKRTGNFIKTQMYKHSYPFCYRTDTPLIYRAISSYFVKVTEIKDKLLANNEKINWTPKSIGDGRFKSWLENVKDWNISRNRYFGTPLPVWVSDDGEEVVVIGSIEELKAYTNFDGDITDIHREFVDKLEIPSKMGKGKLHRINDIFDCWFESGAVPYGQIHYPFENKELVENCDYLSEFIAEGLDQTRGWFYTLLVLSTALFDKPAFKNVICTGLIMDENGMKFSKKYGNFKNPMEVLNKYGADYLRLYLLNSPTIKAEALYFKETDIEKTKQRLIPYINAVKLFMTHFTDHTKNGHVIYDISKEYQENITHSLDRWILTKSANIAKFISEKMENFMVDVCIDKLVSFVDDITNWYIKLNRDRIRGLSGVEERVKSLSVLYNLLMNYIKMMVPFTPFLSEYMFQNLKNLCGFVVNDSCHLIKYPEYDDFIVDNDIMAEFDVIQDLVKNIRVVRNGLKNHTSLKIPISKLIISNNSEKYIELVKKYEDIIFDELNILNIAYDTLNSNISFKAVVNSKALGTKFKGVAPKIRIELETFNQKLLEKFYSNLNENLEVNIDGIIYNVTNNEVQIEIVPASSNFGENYVSQIFGTTMVSVDATYNEELYNTYQIRKIITAVQRLRKSTDLNPWNRIDTEFSCDDDYVFNLLETNKEFLQDRLKCGIIIAKKEKSLDKDIFAQNDFEYEYFSDELSKKIHYIIYRYS